MRHEDVSKKIMLPGLNHTFDEWLCDSFVELIEEMELWKWDDATGDFWSRLAKALQQSNILVTWAEQLDSRLASVHTTGKLSWAAAIRSIRECKMRIERIRGSHLDTDSEVWGLDQTTWELMWAEEADMRKSIPALRQAGYESISELPRIQKSYREKALVVIPLAMRMSATSNSEQRVQVLIPVVQGLSKKQRQLMQQYFELVDWQGLKLPSAERRQRDSLKKFEHSVEVWKDWIRLKKNSQHLVKSCLQWNCYQLGVRVSRSASVSECECLRVRVSQSASVSECECLGVRVSRAASVSDCDCLRLQVSWSASLKARGPTGARAEGECVGVCMFI